MMLLTGLADTLPLVVALRLGVGVAEAAFFVAAFAALADVAPPDRMGEAFSYSSLGLYLGLTLGPPLGEVLVRSAGFTAAWSGAAVLLLVAAVLVHSIGETRPPRTPEDEGPTPFILWTTVPPALGFLTSVVAMGGFLAFASLHAKQVGVAPHQPAPRGVRRGRGGLPRRVRQGPRPAAPTSAGRRRPRGHRGRDDDGGGVGIAGRLPARGRRSWGWGSSFSTPAFFTAIFAAVRPSERGVASGTASACIDIGVGGGSIALGLVAQSHGIPWGFGVAAGVALAGSVWTLGLSRARDGALTRLRASCHGLAGV